MPEERYCLDVVLRQNFQHTRTGRPGDNGQGDGSQCDRGQHQMVQGRKKILRLPPEQVFERIDEIRNSFPE